MQGIILMILFIYGTIFGSFFNVVGIRLTQKTLFKEKRSYCDSCQRTLTLPELIPIFSYLFQKGRCKKCGQKISPLYPIMEGLTGFLFAFSYYQFGWSSSLILSLLLIALIIPVTVSDIFYQKIPNKLLLFFTPLFIIYRIFNPLSPYWNSLFAATFVFFLVLGIILLSKGGMGVGDLKYYTLFAFIFGFYPFLLLFFLSTLYGLVAGFVIMKVRNTGMKTKIAFGPYIGLAALTVLYFGNDIIHFYIQLLN